jgi:hypothetical protein
MSRETGRVDQRCSRTGEILHAKEHLVLLRGRTHQQRLALSLARLESRARITHLSCQHQAFQVGQRLVNYHRTQL